MASDEGLSYIAITVIMSFSLNPFRSCAAPKHREIQGQQSITHIEVPKCIEAIKQIQKERFRDV